MRESREVTCKGIILRTTKYRNSSLLMDVFTQLDGRITVLAKGIMSEKNPYYQFMEIGNELDWQIRKSDSHFYYFQLAELQNAHFHSLSYDASLPLYAAIETYLQLAIPTEESEQFYHLLSNYFRYMHNIKKNGIVIFWRFLLRIFQLYGIPLDLQFCSSCHSTLSNNSSYSVSQNGFLCANCLQEKTTIHLGKTASEIVRKLPEIGNHVNALTISPKTIREIHTIFLRHFENNFHKTFYFKSLKTLC